LPDNVGDFSYEHVRLPLLLQLPGTNTLKPNFNLPGLNHLSASNPQQRVVLKEDIK